MYVALASLFGLVVLLSFSRNLWLADFVVLALLVGLVDRKRRKRILLAAMMGLISVMLGVLLLGRFPVSSETGVALTEALGNRVAEIMGGDITQLQTLDGRLGEIALAWEHIRTSPLLGIGLGAAYYGASDSPWSPGSIQRHPYLVRYVHNGYVSMALKMGIPTLCLYLAISVLFVVQSLRALRRATEWQDRALASAVILSCLGLLIAGMIHPAFLATGGAASIGLLWGMGERLRLELAREGIMVQNGARQEPMPGGAHS
jgi:O-antigen ligase